MHDAQIFKGKAILLLRLTMLFLQISCSSVQVIREASAPAKPSWIDKPPQAAGMMYFVGIATRAETLEQGKEGAIKNATSQIAALIGSKIESRFEQSISSIQTSRIEYPDVGSNKYQSVSTKSLTGAEQQEIKLSVTALSQAIVRGGYLVDSYYERQTRIESKLRLEQFDVYALVRIPRASVNDEVAFQRHLNETKVRAAYAMYAEGKQNIETKHYVQAKQMFGQGLRILKDAGDVVDLPEKNVTVQHLSELLVAELQRADARMKSVSIMVAGDNAFYTSLSEVLTKSGYIVSNENPTFEIAGNVYLVAGPDVLDSAIYYAEGKLTAAKPNDGSIVATIVVGGKGIHKNHRQAAMDALNEAAERVREALANVLSENL